MDIDQMIKIAINKMQMEKVRSSKSLDNIFEKEHSIIFSYFEKYKPKDIMKEDVFRNKVEIFNEKYKDVLDDMEWKDEIRKDGKLITAAEWKKSYTEMVEKFKRRAVSKSLEPKYRYNLSCINCGMAEKSCNCKDSKWYVKSPRIYPEDSNHFLFLPKELRKLILSGYIELDIKYSQLSLLTKRLDLQEAPRVLEKFGSPWKYFESIGIEKSKAKTMVYSAAFGMIKENVAKAVNKSLEELLSEPVIGEIISKRDAEMAKYKPKTEILLSNGKCIQTSNFTALSKVAGKNPRRSLFACEMQSAEFILMSKLFQKMNDETLPPVVSYILHDAYYLDPKYKLYANDIVKYLNSIEPGIQFEMKII